jgi:hypothetical protein
VVIVVIFYLIYTFTKSRSEFTRHQFAIRLKISIRAVLPRGSSCTLQLGVLDLRSLGARAGK